MNIVIALKVAGLCYLTVGMNRISEQLNEYLLKTTKTDLNKLSFSGCELELKMKLLKLLTRVKCLRPTSR